MKVYLSGGFRSNWQAEVKEAVPGCTIINPLWLREAGIELPSAYTLWDLIAIDGCHLVFAYLEESNPFCIGLALEVGYAKARGKHVILVDEKPGVKEFDIVRATADVVVSSLQEGKELLRLLIRLRSQLC